jgi:hypothetical protein
MRARTNHLISSSNKKKVSTRTSQRVSKPTNDNEIEYDYFPSSTNPQPISSPTIQSNIPPLSNYEQKQIVEGLLNHPKDQTLTFDEAQTFAINKAIEIGKNSNLLFIVSNSFFSLCKSKLSDESYII